jgi:hypothetical protein
MKTTEFYSLLLNIYTQIKTPPQYEEISMIDKHITYYLADDGDQFVSSRKTNNNLIVELDIKSAFPTICRNLFGLDSDFVKKMDSIHEKRGRLIYIATTLKEAGDYLAQLNIMCKAIVLGIVFELCHNAVILELKKDGLLFTCDLEDLERLKNIVPVFDSTRMVNIDYNILQNTAPFTKFLIDKEFVFHLTEYESYYRTNKTSIFHKNNEEDIIVKGKYKYMPKQMNNIIKAILEHRLKDLNKLRTTYSSDYFKICQQNGLTELLDSYYICDNDCVLNRVGNYIKYTHIVDIDPMVYLRTFIFPPLLSTKL